MKKSFDIIDTIKNQKNHSFKMKKSFDIIDTIKNQKNHAIKMSRTFDTIKTIKIIQGNTPRVLDYFHFLMNYRNPLEENQVLTSFNYIYNGYKTEFTSLLLKKEDNKWYGLYKEHPILVKPEVYFRNYNSLPILDYYITPNNEVFFITIDNTRMKYLKKVSLYRKLPLQNNFYILIGKERKCSCPYYYWNFNCKHLNLYDKEKETVKQHMKEIMSKKFGNGTLADQICFACEL